MIVKQQLDPSDVFLLITCNIIMLVMPSEGEVSQTSGM